MRTIELAKLVAEVRKFRGDDALPHKGHRHLGELIAFFATNENSYPIHEMWAKDLIAEEAAEVMRQRDDILETVLKYLPGDCTEYVYLGPTYDLIGTDSPMKVLHEAVSKTQIAVHVSEDHSVYAFSFGCGFDGIGSMEFWFGCSHG